MLGSDGREGSGGLHHWFSVGKILQIGSLIDGRFLPGVMGGNRFTGHHRRRALVLFSVPFYIKIFLWLV